MDGIIADIMICLSAIIILGASGLTGYSVYHSLRVNKREKLENGVPVALIGWSTIGGTLLIALPALLFGSFTDMCLITAIILLAAAAGTMIYSKITTLKLRKHVQAQKTT